jgi:hypothetical protein
LGVFCAFVNFYWKYAKQQKNRRADVPNAAVPLSCDGLKLTEQPQELQRERRQEQQPSCGGASWHAS